MRSNNTLKEMLILGVQATLATARQAFSQCTDEAARSLQPLASEGAREDVQATLERRAGVFKGR